ncbi:hypothetical protein D5S18_08055 [Nocardia panacis]|uniref:Uncharacterized protein n=1 Tax=Nocardia panacis TaxID=2340916 RepID=A0A3A4KPI0_9NOCA|nr:hypothetical protein D5S18_08055 [Nocardia panacis]
MAAYLLLQQRLADSERTFHETVESIRHQQAACLRGWKARGEKPAAIAAVTGLSLAELTKLLRLVAEPNQRRTETMNPPGSWIDDAS